LTINLLQQRLTRAKSKWWP